MKLANALCVFLLLSSYRFLTNVANSSNVNPIHNLEQRMDRIEDMALYQLEVLAGIQKSLAMLTGVDDTAGASTTEHSPQNSRPASSVASTAAAPVKRGSLLQQPASK
jgi:hypothetical protein